MLGNAQFSRERSRRNLEEVQPRKEGVCAGTIALHEKSAKIYPQASKLPLKVCKTPCSNSVGSSLISDPKGPSPLPCRRLALAVPALPSLYKTLAIPLPAAG
jgi:hypothetical protein